MSSRLRESLPHLIESVRAPGRFMPVGSRLHRARTMYYLQMGWYELGVDEPIAARGESAVADFEIFLGRPPTPVERDAMEARVAPGTPRRKRQRT